MSDINNSTGGYAYIYAIYPKDNPRSEIKYIGSTTKTLAERLKGHKSNYKRYLNGKYHWMSSCELFDKYGIDGIGIYPYEIYHYDDKADLRRREGKYIEAFECVNKMIAGRFPCEEYMKEYQKRYREENKAKAKEYQKRYREENEDIIKVKILCECGCQVRRSKISEHKKTKKHIDLMKSKN